MIDRQIPRDLPQITLAVLALGVMTAATVWVMAPFMAALVWASMIAIATWPILLWLQRRLGGRRGPAVALMLIPLLAVLIVPVWVSIWAIAGNADRIVELSRRLVTQGLPPLPQWLTSLPLIGPRIAEGWLHLAGDPGSIGARLMPYAGNATGWLLAKIGSVGATVVQLILTVIITGILYTTGEKAGLGVRRFLRRLAGERGENAAILAAQAVKAVALGIVVTALTQTVLSGIGLLLAGVPAAGLLTAIILVLCIAQIGPLLVLLPATIWLYSSGASGRGTVLVVITLVASTMDNLLRPLLIKQGAHLPLLLIIAGVIGGLISFGVVGLFVGPVILAVTWTLVGSWMAELDHPKTAP
jgi:predicted PurR-regulated permease PerM